MKQQTTKQNQIDFMWHLHGQGFTHKEIAKIYNVPPHRIETALNSKTRR